MILIFKRQRQEELHKFEGSLVYTVSSKSDSVIQ